MEGESKVKAKSCDKLNATRSSSLAPHFAFGLTQRPRRRSRSNTSIHRRHYITRALFFKHAQNQPLHPSLMGVGEGPPAGCRLSIRQLIEARCTYRGVHHVDRRHLVNRALVRHPVRRLAPTELVDERLELPAIRAPEVLAVGARARRAVVVLLVRCLSRRLVLDRDVMVELDRREQDAHRRRTGRQTCGIMKL
jgi:hypothetical protein